MFSEVMQIVDAGNYELVDFLHRLDVLYAKGKLTEDEYDSAIDAAREHADPEKSKPEELARLTALEVAVRDLTDRVAALESGGDTPETPVSEYIDGYQYKKGERCIWEGKIYEWALDVPGVWSPGAYPGGWTLIGDAQ